MTREQIEQTLAQEYAKNHRFGEIGGPEWTRDLARRYIAAGLGTPQDREDAQPEPAERRAATAQARKDAAGRAELHAAVRAQWHAGAIPHDDYVQFLSQKAFDPQLTPQERTRAVSEMGRLEARRQTQEARQQKAQEKDDARGPADDLDRRRREVEKTVRNKYAASEELRPRMGGERYRKEVAAAHKAAGTDIASDAEHANHGPLAGYAIRSLLEGAIGTGIAAGARNGAQFGNAVGAIAGGINAAVMGAAGGFLKIGEAIVGLILSPFGKSGAAASGLVTGLAQSALSIIGGAGHLIQSGVKGVVGLAGGIVGGGATALLAGGGALLGSAIPIIGTLGGGAAGAALGAAVTGVLSSLANTLGGFAGSALGAIGKVFESVGTGISTLLTGLMGLVSDLIGTSTRYAAAASNNALNGGLSLAGGAQSASLATVLTGSSSGLSSFYGNMGNMAPWGASRLAAFGIRGTSPNAPASMVTGAYNRIQELQRTMPGPTGSIIGRMDLQQAFGPQADRIMQVIQAGPAAVQDLVKTVRENQQKPQDAVASLKLDFQTAALQLQLDGIKLKLAEAILPLANRFLPMLRAGVEHAGAFLGTRFPSLLKTGIDAVLGFGAAIGTALPKIFDVIKGAIISVIQFTQAVSRDLAGNPLVKMASPALAKGLADYGGMSLTSMGLTSPEQEAERGVAERRRKQAGWVQGQLNDENGVNVGNNDTGPEDFRNVNAGTTTETHAQTVARLTATRDRLLKEADDADAAGRNADPLKAQVADLSKTLRDTFTDWRHTADSALAANAKGTDGDNTHRAGPQGNELALHIYNHAEENPDALYAHSQKLLVTLARGQVRAIMHSN